MCDNADLFGHAVAAAPARTRQLPLPLAWGPWAHGAADSVLIDSSNAHVARHIEQAAHWSAPASLLVGPPRSGKSRFGQMFAASGAGEVIDDLASHSEDAVFHAWNRAESSGHALLIIAASMEAIDQVRLPDLRTRLASAPVIQIGPPDIALSAALLERLLAERGLAATPGLGAYAAERIERSYVAVHALADAMDALALGSGRSVGTALVRDALRADLAAVSAPESGLARHEIVTNLTASP